MLRSGVAVERGRTSGRTLLWALAMLATTVAYGQEAAENRRSEIEAERIEKSTRLTPQRPPKNEEKFQRFTESDIFNRVLGPAAGLGVRLGGLPTGSGFALGPRYYRPDLAGENLVFKAWAVGSVSQFYETAVSLGLPHLLHERATVEFAAARNDSPALEYYGSGPKSDQKNRSSFRREQMDVRFIAGVRPLRRHLTLGFETGYTPLNIGPGTRDGIPSSDQIFTAATAPGIQVQSSYTRVGPVVTLDRRDLPRDPHKGTFFEAKYLFYKGLDQEQFSFQKVSGVLEQYIPFLNEKRVIALRARTEWNLTDRKHVVPFYMQAVIGGSEDLRGYPRFRFYDDNAAAMSAEYRWEVMPALDMALFADAGQVFSKRNHFDWDEMRGAGGFGFRLKNRNAVVVRLDFGFSREGYQVWLKFGNTF